MCEQYRKDVLKYQKSDAVTAIWVWAAVMAVIFAAAVLSGYFYYWVNMIIAVLPVFIPLTIVMKNKSGILSLGIHKRELAASLRLGLFFGIIAMIIHQGVLPAIVYGWKLAPIGSLLFELFYYFVIIALIEEIIFRGYIQTRLFGMIKNETAAVLLAAVLFALYHLPFQFTNNGIALLSNIAFYTSFIYNITGHIVFYLIYRKYNSIWGAVVFHALGDWAGSMFIMDSRVIWIDMAWLGIYIIVSVIFVVKTFKGKIQ